MTVGEWEYLHVDETQLLHGNDSVIVEQLVKLAHLSTDRQFCHRSV